MPINVNLHETRNRVTESAFCFGNNTLQIQKEIINQLNAERDQTIVNFQFYYDEMEKIHENTFEGGSHVLTPESVQTDTFIGSLGLDTIDNYSIKETGGRYDGIC